MCGNSTRPQLRFMATVLCSQVAEGSTCAVIPRLDVHWIDKIHVLVAPVQWRIQNLKKRGSKGRGARSAPENFKATPTFITDTPTFCARKLASMLAVARMELITVVQVS